MFYSYRGYAFVKPLSSKVIIADKNHFVYSLFVKNVPFLSVVNKNVFDERDETRKKQGTATVLVQSLGVVRERQRYRRTATL